MMPGWRQLEKELMKTDNALDKVLEMMGVRDGPKFKKPPMRHLPNSIHEDKEDGMGMSDEDRKRIRKSVGGDLRYLIIDGVLQAIEDDEENTS